MKCTPNKSQNQSEAASEACLPFIIGIGASAGGLESIRAFLADFHESNGVAFVVVQHMAPKYRSMLPELLARDAHIKVEEATDHIRPKPNTLYVTPPNHDILFKDGELRLVSPPTRIGPKPSVDRFFTSIADELGENCGGIVLSGTGSDGAQGVKAIKAAGGFVVAQNPESAKYDGMPRAAINTGIVDHILTPKEIASQLGSIISHLMMQAAIELPSYPDEPFKAILELLKQHSKVDFTQYKPNTLKRRLQRRMRANRFDSIESYFEHLQNDEGEVRRLFQDVLISVTAFFRDSEQYAALRQLIKEKILAHDGTGPLRIWSAGASSGEEPYSIAIMVSDLIRELRLSIDIQIFATDINEEAMTAARRGSYSATSLEGVDTEVIERYFDRLDGALQIKKHIRERVVFARHDLTRDPPFLKMDLICCRNVFIYFDQKLQDRIIKIFHYALKPRGFLFLGRSESIGSTKSYFRTFDNTHKIYQRNDRAIDPTISFSNLQLERSENKIKPDWPKVRDLAEQMNELVRSFAPNSIIIDEDFSIRQIYGTAKRYLDFPEGTLNQSIEKLLHESLKNKVMTLLHRAKRSGDVASGLHMDVEIQGQRDLVLPKVYPIKMNHEPRLVLNFESIAPVDDEKKTAGRSRSKSMAKEVDNLERELAATREHLQTVIEELETSNEELQALNEELHSANEELQSTNEELETSNEELQSTNEELTTLNEELNVKTTELLDLNNYLSAIQDAIQSPIIVVDKNLNLVRYNRCAERSFQLNPSHLAKNVRLIPSNESLEKPFEAIERALKERVQKTIQISTKNHDSLVRCDPFFNHKDEVEGIVATFADNTDLFKILRAIEASESKLRAIFENIPAAVSTKNTLGIYTYVNHNFSTRFGLSPDTIIGKSDDQIFDPKIARGMRELDISVFANCESRRDEEAIPTPDGKRTLLTSRFPLLGADGLVESVCAVSLDITDTVISRNRLELFKETITASRQGILICEIGHDDRYHVTFASPSIEDLLDVQAHDLVDLDFEKALNRLFKLNGCSEGQRFVEETLASTGGALEAKRLVHGKKHWYEVRSTVYHPPEGKSSTQLSLIIIDVTARKESEILLRQKQEEVLKAAKLASLGEMAAGIAHELNTPLATVQSYVDLIRSGRSKKLYDSDLTSQSLDKIETTVTRISEIIVGLRSFSRLDKNVSVASFDLMNLIHEVLRICDFHLKNKGVKIEVDACDEMIQLQGRQTQISQVFVNLINNSIDAIKNLQERWIKIRTAKTGETVTIQVIDSGEGIPEKIAAMVMTPFFTTKDEGTGLGLSLSRSLIKAHGGDLKINPTLKNTCFEIILPIVGADHSRPQPM